MTLYEVLKAIDEKVNISATGLSAADIVIDPSKGHVQERILCQPRQY